MDLCFTLNKVYIAILVVYWDFSLIFVDIIPVKIAAPDMQKVIELNTYLQ